LGGRCRRGLPPRRSGRGLRGRLAPMTRASPPQIHKVAGAALASGAAIAHAVSIIQAHRPAPLVVVVSAMAGVTDALLEIASRAVHGDREHTRSAAAALRARHGEAARSVLRAGAALDDTLELIDQSFAARGRPT